jgi:hypothetical protein
MNWPIVSRTRATSRMRSSSPAALAGKGSDTRVRYSQASAERGSLVQKAGRAGESLSPVRASPGRFSIRRLPGRILTRDAFKDAVTKMNLITNHEFVYRRWHDGEYRRYPARKQSQSLT